MKTTELRTRAVFFTALLALTLSACGPGTHTQTVKPTAALYAEQQIPEDQLLDVGIAVLDVAEATDDEDREEGYQPELKQAEAHYIPYHLKNTLQLTGHWGAVRVTPIETDGVEVIVNGSIEKSNGEELIVRLQVRDASGETWFTKEYEAAADERSYTDTRKGAKDPYQSLYNTFSNDLLAHKQQLTPKDIQRIQALSKLKFAADVAPAAFKDYIRQRNNGTYELHRLPADNDPLMARVLQVREREYMLIDTVNDFYSRFYDEMWEPYLDWRVSYLEEANAKRELQRKALNRQLLGVAAILGAIAYEVAGGDSTSPTVSSMLVLGGVNAISSGMQYSQDARIHADAIRELNDSFGSEMSPMVVDMEGQTVRLKGSAEEQYREWRRLLRELFIAETGFTPSAEVKRTAPVPIRSSLPMPGIK